MAGHSVQTPGLPTSQHHTHSFGATLLSLDCGLPDGRAQFDSFLDSQHPASTVLGQGEKFDKYLLISEKESVKEMTSFLKSTNRYQQVDINTVLREGSCLEKVSYIEVSIIITEALIQSLHAVTDR